MCFFLTKIQDESRWAWKLISFTNWCCSKTSVDIDALINWSYFRNGLQKSIYCLQSSQISVSANFRLRKPRSKTRVWQLLAGVDIGHWSDNLWGQCQSWQSDGKYCWGWVAALVGYLDILNILIWNIWQSDGKHCRGCLCWWDMWIF